MQERQPRADHKGGWETKRQPRAAQEGNHEGRRAWETRRQRHYDQKQCRLLRCHFLASFRRPPLASSLFYEFYFLMALLKDLNICGSKSKPRPRRGSRRTRCPRFCCCSKTRTLVFVCFWMLGSPTFGFFKQVFCLRFSRGCLKPFGSWPLLVFALGIFLVLLSWFDHFWPYDFMGVNCFFKLFFLAFLRKSKVLVIPLAFKKLYFSKVF